MQARVSKWSFRSGPQNHRKNLEKFGSCPLRCKTLVFRRFFAFLANCFGFPARPCTCMLAHAASSSALPWCLVSRLVSRQRRLRTLVFPRKPACFAVNGVGFKQSNEKTHQDPQGPTTPPSARFTIQVVLFAKVALPTSNNTLSDIVCFQILHLRFHIFPLPRLYSLVWAIPSAITILITLDICIHIIKAIWCRINILTPF